MHKSKSLGLHQKIKAPTNADVAAWVPSGLKQLQEKPDMIMCSFDACGITNASATETRPTEMLNGQMCSDSEDEHDNPFIDEEEDGLMMEM